MNEVLFVPEIEINILSVLKLTKHGMNFIFKNEKCEINFKKQSVAIAEIKENLFTLIEFTNNIKQENQNYDLLPIKEEKCEDLVNIAGTKIIGVEEIFFDTNESLELM